MRMDGRTGVRDEEDRPVLRLGESVEIATIKITIFWDVTPCSLL